MAPPASTAVRLEATRRSHDSHDWSVARHRRSTRRAGCRRRCSSPASTKRRASAARYASRLVRWTRSSVLKSACTACYRRCAAAASCASRPARSIASRWRPQDANGARTMRTPRAHAMPTRHAGMRMPPRPPAFTKAANGRRPSPLRSLGRGRAVQTRCRRCNRRCRRCNSFPRQLHLRHRAELRHLHRSAYDERSTAARFRTSA